MPTIEITQEQLDALNAGKDVTLAAPKKQKFLYDILAWDHNKTALFVVRNAQFDTGMIAYWGRWECVYTSPRHIGPVKLNDEGSHGDFPVNRVVEILFTHPK